MTRHREIAADLARRLLADEFPVGAVLPSEGALAREYVAARNTIRSALASLERRGMLEPQQGFGWTVVRARQGRRFGELRSFAEWAVSQGFRPGGRVVRSEWRRANAMDARVLRLADETVLDVTRLRTLDGRPAMLQRAVYAPWIAPLIDGLPPDTPSVRRAIEESGVALQYGTHRFDAVSASAADARALGVRRTGPLSRVRFQTFTADGTPIAHNDERYLPGVVQFEIGGDAPPRGLQRVVP